jgi:hypothetical protein
MNRNIVSIKTFSQYKILITKKYKIYLQLQIKIYLRHRIIIYLLHQIIMYLRHLTKMIKQKNVNQLLNSKIIPIKHSIKTQIICKFIRKKIKPLKTYLNNYYKNIIKTNYIKLIIDRNKKVKAHNLNK